MAKYITELAVSISKREEEKLTAQGFKKILADLNDGTSGSETFLWYKNGSSGAITRIQFSFDQDMEKGLIDAGFLKINNELNAQTSGDPVNLWYFRGSGEYDRPIVEINITMSAADEARKFGQDFERSACNLSRNTGGRGIYLWVKREKPMYICDIIATKSFGSDATYFNQGYIRVDQEVIRGAGRASVFIWYRHTTSRTNAITNVDMSTNEEEYKSLQQQDYKIVPVNLNKDTGGNLVYLWYKKDQVSSPIKDVRVLINTEAVVPYLKEGVKVIKGTPSLSKRFTVTRLHSVSVTTVIMTSN